MRLNIVVILLCLPYILFSQSWMKERSFSSMSAKSDLLVEGIIIKIETIEKDKKLGLDMPLKKAIVQIESIKKGESIGGELSVYYTDIFTGCGNWPVIVTHRLGDSILLFARERNDSIFQNHAFDQSTSQQNSLAFAKRMDELIQIKNSDDAVKVTLAKEWIVTCAEDKQTTEDVSSLLKYDAFRLLKFLDVKIEKFEFSEEQRLRIYAVLKRFNKIEHENEGLLQIMHGWTDERYALILKRYLINTNHEKYPDTVHREYLLESLVDYYYFDKKLKDLLKKYKKNATKQKELTDAFMLRI